MSVFDVQFPYDLMRQLENMGRINLHAPRIINAVLPILERSMKAGYERHKVSGELAGSIVIKEARINKHGYFGYVVPDGIDENYMRNGEKAAYLEYGTRHQDPHPVVAPAVNAVKEEILQKMQEEFNNVVGR